MRSVTTIVILLSCLLVAPAALAGKTLVHQGMLEDARRKPIGGVFPLSFSLHKKPKGGKTLWSESHFVAVDHGNYEVELGVTRPISDKLDLTKLFLSVSVTGGDEIVRERVNVKGLRDTREQPSEVTAAVSGPAVDASRTGKGGTKGIVDYAETAGLAYEAEHAKSADRIGSLTEEDLEERMKRSGGKARIGANKRFTSLAGGEAGLPYELKCPKGYVVTGVRGGGGIYIDSIQLICSPLE